MSHHCPDCGGELTFVAHIAAPGYGLAYECKPCDLDFRVVGDTLEDYRYDDVQVDMPVSWVI